MTKIKLVALIEKITMEMPMRVIADCLLIAATIHLQHPVLVIACLCVAVDLASRYIQVCRTGA